MKRLKIISILIIASCSGAEIELPDGQESLVIEGWITNQDKQHQVKISKTVPFDASQSEVPVEDAIVIIEDNVSSFPLTHSANGVYLTAAFQGIIARSYRVIVELSNGETIQSNWDRLNPLMPIDTIQYGFFDDQDPITGEDIDVYFPIVISSDPINETNFYRYKGFRNGELLSEPNELILLSDQFVNGAATLPNFIPEFRYAFEDTIQVELHSLTRAGFEFLELLKSQTTSLGSSSGTFPATLTGNLGYLDNKELVLGFFGASFVSADSTIINQ
ncbi:MAG: DUF4249 domain-containing protein [Cytophagales bacterium]|nr:DUF4249 domain-containing protein [Cytophagales bacterium]